jgi:hypothetical protein
MADQLGEIRTAWIRSHGPGLWVKIEATELLGGQSIKQGLGSLFCLDPLVFQFREINRADEVFASQFALLVARVAIRHIKDSWRRESRVDATRCPDDGAQAQIPPIELKGIEEVPDFGTPDEGEHLARRQIGQMEAVPEDFIALGGEESEG